MMIEYGNNNIERKEETLQKSYISILPTAKVIKEAPILVLIFRPNDKDWIVSDNLSIGACVENMCLRALDFDLGTLWIRDILYVSNEVAAWSF